MIEYTADLSYMPVDGEKIENNVTISGNGSEINHASSAVKIQIAGGTGVAYDFGIKIHKVDENNKSLKGAKFQVIRVANNQLIGEFETNKDGEIVVKNLFERPIYHQRNFSSRRL
ncbi:MAG: collagen binding domain-containing protein [Streptococcus parasanguinis]